MSEDTKKEEKTTEEAPVETVEETSVEEQPEQKAEETTEAPAEEAAASEETTEEKKEEATEETPAEDEGAPIEDENKIQEQEEQAKQQAEEESQEAEEIKKVELRPGMTIRVHERIREGEKERVQVFQGIVLALRGKKEAEKTVTVRKTSFGIGVEKIFPLASPLVEKIEVVKVAKVRQSKLYYLRNYGKKLREQFVK